MPNMLSSWNKVIIITNWPTGAGEVWTVKNELWLVKHEQWTVNFEMSLSIVFYT